jgi:anti-sigma-K factor RskA
MAEPKDLRDLVGEDVPDEELERLRRAHELLVAAGPPPELSPMLEAAPPVGPSEPREGRLSFLPRRRLGTAFAVAVAIAAIAFGAGYFTGKREPGSERTVDMRGTALAPSAAASIKVGAEDKAGNVPMVVHVRGLPKLAARGYYTLYLTRKRKPVVSCGAFTVVGPTKTTEVQLSIPYMLGRYDGWVVSRERPRGPHPGPVVLTTF